MAMSSSLSGLKPAAADLPNVFRSDAVDFHRDELGPVGIDAGSRMPLT